MADPTTPTIVPPPELGVLVGLAGLTASEELAVGKDGVNEFFGYRFMTEPDLFRAAKAALAKTALSATISFESGMHETISTFDKDGNERPAIMATVTARLTIRDQVGMAVECTAYGQGIDTADKAYAKAQTMASKYVIAKAMLIVVEGEDTDASEGHAVARRGNGDGAGTASDKQLGYLVSLVKKIHLADAAGAEQAAWRLARMAGDAAPAFADISKRTASDVIERLKKVEDNPQAGTVINERLAAWEVEQGLSPLPATSSGQPDEPTPASPAVPATTAGPPMRSPAETGMNDDDDLPF